MCEAVPKLQLHELDRMQVDGPDLDQQIDKMVVPRAALAGTIAAMRERLKMPVSATIARVIRSCFRRKQDEEETDFVAKGEAALKLVRSYNKATEQVGLFGKHWISTFDYKLTFGSLAVNGCYPRPGGGACGIGVNTEIYAHRPDARIIKFIKAADGIFYEDKPAPIADRCARDGTSCTMGGHDIEK